MKISEVKYAKKFNLGNFESEEYSIVVVPGAKETPQEAFEACKLAVAEAYGGATNPTARDVEEVEVEEVVEEVVEEDDTEVVEEEVEDEGNDESEEEETEKKPSKKSASPTAGAKAGKVAGKTFKPKPQNYSRANETHKEIFSNLLKSVAPDWKKSFESKELAKSTSKKMDGTAFLDADGEVIAEFKSKVKKMMGGKK